MEEIISGKWISAPSDKNLIPLRLADAEAKPKFAERRARNRRLIDAGISVEKAGLSVLATDALYGALLSLVAGAENAKQLGQWASAGADAVAQEARPADSEAVILTFPAQLDKEAAAVLRAVGYRFNKVLRHREGLANFLEVEAVAADYGGKAHKLSYPIESSKLA